GFSPITLSHNFEKGYGDFLEAEGIVHPKILNVQRLYERKSSYGIAEFSLPTNK
ncbi:hypothetical protein HAX54_040712, partial [Datura stramonium]|nr:hypothetical protein [Datura stramonium]